MSRIPAFAAVAAVTLISTSAWAPPPPGPPPGNGGGGVPLERVIYVSGDDTAADNGAELLASIGEIGTDGPCSSPGPSTDAPCLVKIGPGVYDIGDNTLFMVAHVDIEGSGQGITVITGATDNTALLSGADAELRFLTAENTQADASIVRAIITAGSDMRISHVTAIADGNPNSNRNVAIAVGGGGGAPILTDVTAITEPSIGIARAIEVSDSAEPLLTNVMAISTQAALVLVGEDDETVTVQNSLLRGEDFSFLVPNTLGGTKVVNIHASQLEGKVQPNGSGHTVNVTASLLDGDANPLGSSTVNLASSQLDGAANTGGGTVNCIFVSDGAFGSHSCNP